ncbi:hypothetical protein FN846DRAFT_455523 [Sphaerosporella brunnea]|uniref:Uncharacterized protein n=1 Tax=Sphaerosporella brunnea TaxID=1250544 RepID=A0A5J5EFN3_9PEZI|nr:hypothetical protein FN846DRAFT_455523 [Sphaerosporella brunnea]
MLYQRCLPCHNTVRFPNSPTSADDKMFCRLSPVTEPNRESSGRPNAAPLSQILQEPSPQSHAVPRRQRRKPAIKDPEPQVKRRRNHSFCRVGALDPDRSFPSSRALDHSSWPSLAPWPLLSLRRCSGLLHLSFSGMLVAPLSLPAALLPPSVAR